MSKGLTKKYYQLTKEEFEAFLSSVKDSPTTLHFFDEINESYFFYFDEEIINAITRISILQSLFDQTINEFSIFGQNQLIMTYFIDEVISTNEIESIYSTRHDILSLINRIDTKENEKIKSIVYTYKALLNHRYPKIDSVEDIRSEYDNFTFDILADEEKLDGEWFRKDRVFINDGLKNIHNGFYPEEKIIVGLNEFLTVFNNKRLEINLRNILSHFLLETIHPFYDVNGRFGRYLMTINLLKETKSISALLISSAINSNKGKYYRALRNARDEKSFGCLNQYVIEMCEIYSEYLRDCIQDLKIKREIINNITLDKKDLTKSEKEVLKLIKEGSVLSDIGVTNKEIMENCHVSKRTLQYALKKFDELGICKNQKIGKKIYHYTE